ncbi:MAG: hypothetical protein QF554_01485 [Dehalococcoidia bacterium]|jgi:hypothetical protein|nr:hypothetical protein [Dehalococcoidia bacterium]
MAFSALVFPMLVMALTAGVFTTAWRSDSPMRAFRGSFTWTFALVLFTPWVGAYSPELAMVNGTVAGILAAGMWWLLQRRTRTRGANSAVSV